MTMLRVPEVHVGRGTVRGPLTVFPVWSEAPLLPAIATGAEAALQVAELDEDPDASRVQVLNPGDRPALLVEGELLEGGWQTRAVVRDTIVEPRTLRAVEVICVEQHRWGGSSGHERRARRATPRVMRSLRSIGPLREDRVWEDVERYRPTGATEMWSLGDRLTAFTNSQHDDPPLSPLPGQMGVLIGTDGQPLILELFASPSALASHLPAVLDAVGLETLLATGATEPVPGRRARRLANAFRGEDLAVFITEDAGYGLSVIAESDHAELRGVAMDGGVAHLSILNIKHSLLEMT